MKLPSILLASLLAAGCATSGYSPSYRFNELMVHNLSGSEIEDVSVRVVGSEKALQCDKVAFNATCHERFNYRPYPQQGIELSWIHEDGNRRSETIDQRVPGVLYKWHPLRVVMEVDPDGMVKLIYEQDDSIPSN